MEAGKFLSELINLRLGVEPIGNKVKVVAAWRTGPGDEMDLQSPTVAVLPTSAENKTQLCMTLYLEELYVKYMLKDEDGYSDVLSIASSALELTDSENGGWVEVDEDVPAEFEQCAYDMKLAAVTVNVVHSPSTKLLTVVQPLLKHVRMVLAGEYSDKAYWTSFKHAFEHSVWKDKKDKWKLASRAMTTYGKDIETMIEEVNSSGADVAAIQKGVVGLTKWSKQCGGIGLRCRCGDLRGCCQGSCYPERIRQGSDTSGHECTYGTSCSFD